MLTHLRLPADTTAVTLPAVDKIASSISLAAGYGQAVVVHGPLGTGKYTATKMALNKLGLPAVELDLEPAMSSKAVVRRLHNALVGHDDVSERDLQDDVIEALATESRPVLVRHCDRLTREATGQLHWLHAHPDVRFPLLLVGGPATGRALRAEAHLAGNVVQTVEVTALDGRELLDAVQSLHMLLTGAGADLLAVIDKQVCRGLIRNWVTFLTVALHERDKIIAAGAPAPVLGRELATIAVRAMPTTLKNLGVA